MPVPDTPAMEPSLPSARQLAWLLIHPISALDAVAAAVVARVEQDVTAKAVADLARRFTAPVRAAGVSKAATAGRNAVAEFKDWIRKAEACTASAIATFASGLVGDGIAVRAALTEPWSGGQAEGQINRLKPSSARATGERASICSSAA